MKKMYLVIAIAAIALNTSAQSELIPLTWAGHFDEFDYAGTPYTKTVAHATYSELPVNTSDLDFDNLWNTIPNTPYEVAKPTNIEGGDVYDDNFGVRFKVTYNVEALYILLKYLDDDSWAESGSRAFEVLFNPYKDRNDTMFQTATDTITQNFAYACYSYWGGKAYFKDGEVTEYMACGGSNNSDWRNNEKGLAALNFDEHYWELDGNTINAVLVADLDSVIGINPFTDNGPDTISFDIKSTAFANGGTKENNSAEYFFSSTNNFGIYSLYYRGYLIFDGITSKPNVTTNNLTIAQNGTQLAIHGVDARQVVVRNVVGQEIICTSNSNIVNITNLKKGAYIVTINGIYSKKFVK